MPDPVQSSSTFASGWAELEGSPNCEGPGPLACYEVSAATHSPKPPTVPPPDPGAHPDAVESLCERRLATNDLLCNVLGSVAAGRLGGSLLVQASMSSAIAEACVHVAGWLEHHAPGGACGEESK